MLQILGKFLGEIGKTLIVFILLAVIPVMEPFRNFIFALAFFGFLLWVIGEVITDFSDYK